MKQRLFGLFLATSLGFACAAPSNEGPPAKKSAVRPQPQPQPQPGKTDPPAAPQPRPPVAAKCETTAEADVWVQIDAAAGPKNGPPVKGNNDLLSMNINDYVWKDFASKTGGQALNPVFTAYLKALRPGMLRFPEGLNSQYYHWSTTADFTKNVPRNSERNVLTPAFIDAFMNLCNAVGARPFLALNMMTGTPQEAQAIVRYVNVEKKYGVKWFQLGNEPDLQSNWAPGRSTPEDYANTFRTFRQALVQVDPQIKLVGGEMYTGGSINGEGGQSDWMGPIVQNLKTDIDAAAWHYYPLYTSAPQSSSAYMSVENLFQENAANWKPAGMNYPDIIMPYLWDMLAKSSPNAGIFVDEMAEDPGDLASQGFGDTMAGAIWSSDSLARFAEHGVTAVFKFLFKGESPHYYALMDTEDRPRPEYYTYWLYAQHFGDTWVKATSYQAPADKTAVPTAVDPTQIASHAALRQDGGLSVMLSNKSAASQRVRLQLKNFTPYTGRAFTLSGVPNTSSKLCVGFNKGQDDTVCSMQATVNGQTLTMANIDRGDQAIAGLPAEPCQDNVITVPAYSVMVVRFDT